MKTVDFENRLSFNPKKIFYKQVTRFGTVTNLTQRFILCQHLVAKKLCQLKRI